MIFSIAQSVRLDSMRRRIIARTAVQRWMGVQKVAEYIDKALLKELLERYGCDKDLLGIVDCIQPSVVLCKDCEFYKDKKFIFMVADWKFHKAGKCQLRELYGIEEVVFPEYFCGDGKWREGKDG